MMQKTIRHQIIDAVTARLTVYPWQSASFTVIPGRTVFDPTADPLPILALIPEREETTKGRYGVDDNSMPITLSAILRLNLKEGEVESAIELAEPVLGEVHKAACQAATHPTLIDLVDSIDYTGGGVDQWPGEQGQTIVTVGISLTIRYSTDTNNPYA